MAKPFESQIQDLVYNVDVGVGLRIIKFGVYVLFVLSVLLVYTATQFTGFSDGKAMEYAQLGRNLSERGELVTQVVRPSSIRFLIENKGTTSIDENGEEVARGGDPRFVDHPDVLNAPLYPAAIAGWFKLLGTEFDYVADGGKHKPELQMITLCHLFTILTGVILWLLGRKMFDNRVGLLGMTLFFLSDQVWATSISGLALAMTACLASLALYCAILSVSSRESESAGLRWVAPYLLSALFCVLAIHTRYGAWVIVPGLALYYGIGFSRRGWIAALALVLMVSAAMIPWMTRNVEVSGAAFGMAPGTVLTETGVFPGNSYDRNLAPDESLLEFQMSYKAVRAKFFSNLKEYYRGSVRTVGDGILICLFITTFLYRFVRRNVHQFRWCILLSLFLLFLAAGFYGDRMISLTYIFLPVIIIYAVAFYFILLDRLQLPMAIQGMAVTTIVVLLCIGPMLMTLMPPKKKFPYPPYNRPIITHVATLLEEEESLCSDIPWATAWYGGRNSLLLPQTIDEFYEINDFIQTLSALYFTPVTRDLPYVRGLLVGRDRTWFPIQQGRMPTDFPLTQGFPLFNLDQLFITDRDRLTELSEGE